MKNLFILLFTQTLVISSFSQFDNAKDNYSVTFQSDYIKANKISKEVIFDYKLNENGEIDSTLKITLLYDRFGNYIKKYLSYPQQNENAISMYSNIYSSTEKLLKQIEYDQDTTIVSISEYDYDRFGNETNLHKYNNDSTEIYVEQKVYNNKNQIVLLVKKSSTRKRENFYSAIKYYYNQENELSKEELLDKKGKVLSTYSYDYNKSLNRRIAYIENKKQRKVDGEYFYNASNQCIQINGIFNSVSTTTTTFSDGSDINMKKSSATISFFDKAESIQRFGSNMVTGQDISINQNNPNRSTIITPINSPYNIISRNIYNDDKTIFETNVYVDGKKVKMNRHYYIR